MDEMELPAPIDDLIVRSVQPTTPSPSAPHEPNSKPVSMVTGFPDLTASSLTRDGQNLDPNGANGPGGVSGAAPAAAAQPPTAMNLSHADAVSPFPAPLIPEQPLPPGAPPSLAAAQRGESPELSTPSTGLSTGSPHEPSARAHEEQAGSAPTSPASGLIGPGELGAADRKALNGRPHPWKPVTPPQIAEFSQMWFDRAYTIEQIARRYKTTDRTLHRWRQEFGLPPKEDAVAQSTTAEGILGAASAAINGLSQAATITQAMARAAAPATETQMGQAIHGTVIDPKKFDPLADPEIVTMLEDIRTEARMITAHSDLQVIQRKLMKLAVLSATKVPTRSWEGLTVVVEALQRSILNARRIEADIPGSAADPVLLRKEAAGQMMKELKSVLTPDEQLVLAKLVKAGADRLMNKGGDASSVTAGVEG